MKGKVLILLAVLLLLSGSAYAEMQMGVSTGDAENFMLSVSEYFNVPEKEIMTVQQRGISTEETSVALFMSQQTGTSASAIVDLRLGGKSWMDIAVQYKMTPEVFYVAVPQGGPPHGKAYGKFKKPKHEWKNMRLADSDVVNLVNLRFISEHYGYSPDEVMRMREEGKGFAAINRAVRKTKPGREMPRQEMKEMKEMKEHKMMKEEKGKHKGGKGR